MRQVRQARNTPAVAEVHGSPRPSFQRRGHAVIGILRDGVQSCQDRTFLPDERRLRLTLSGRWKR